MSIPDREPLEPEPTVITDSSQRKFGKYRLCFEIASGGMATVFLARAVGHAGFEKLVALKRVHPHLANEQQFTDMFLDEARIASRINHPGVCQVFDFGEANGIYYLAMEYLVGEAVSRIIRTLIKSEDPALAGRMPLFAARIVADACEGLHAAHELRGPTGELLQVVHRDVSPHNIFLTYDGVIKVVDFGIASATDRVHHTETGTVKGKYAYMAPEQLRGERVDRRADVWSLGVVLWEMLTLQRLFRRKSEAETILAVQSDTIPMPTEIDPRLPPELDAILLYALSRDASGRYSTAREMGRELNRFLSNVREPVGSPELSDWMAALFPGGRDRKQQLVEIAMQPEDAVPQVREESSHSGSHSDASGSVSRMRRVTPDTLEETRRTGRFRITNQWFALAALLMIGLGSFAAVLVAMSGTSETQPSDGPPADPPLAPVTPAEPTTVPPVDPPEEPASEPSEAEAAAPPEQPPAVAEEPAPVVAAESPVAAEPTPESPVAPEADRPREPHAATQEREPAVTGTGTVQLAVRGGWAKVRHRGREIGQAPGRFTLPAGRQVLVVLPFGEPPARRVVVDVRPGGTIRQSVDIR